MQRVEWMPAGRFMGTARCAQWLEISIGGPHRVSFFPSTLYTLSSSIDRGAIGHISITCALGLLLSFAIVALTTKITLVLGGSRGQRRVLRQRHCPPELIRRHTEKIAIPATGGIWLITAQVAVFTCLMNRSDLASWILLLAALGFGAAGAWDDFVKVRRRTARREKAGYRVRDVSARAKFLAQALLALLLLIPLTSTRFHRGLAGAMGTESSRELPLQTPKDLDQNAVETKEEQRDLSEICSEFFLPLKSSSILRVSGWQHLLALLFFAFVVIGSSNAVNLTDGLDGLAGGCALLVSCALMVGAICSGNAQIAARFHLPHIASADQVAIYLSGVVGGLLGFLLFNHHPARIFMGDIGSLSLGAVLGFSALLIRQEWLLACSGAVLVAETLSVILQVASYRIRRGKRLFLCTPLHHHFECLGWNERKVVRYFWLATLLFSALGVALLINPWK